MPLSDHSLRIPRPPDRMSFHATDTVCSSLSGNYQNTDESYHVFATGQEKWRPYTRQYLRGKKTGDRALAPSPATGPKDRWDKYGRIPDRL